VNKGDDYQHQRVSSELLDPAVRGDVIEERRRSVPGFNEVGAFASRAPFVCRIPPADETRNLLPVEIRQYKMWNFGAKSNVAGRSRRYYTSSTFGGEIAIDFIHHAKPVQLVGLLV
jgi:hypothetical protein